MRKISIQNMDLEKYMSMYGYDYNEGNLFDYPIEELDYILNDTDIANLALIDNRLYEIR